MKSTIERPARAGAYYWVILAIIAWGSWFYFAWGWFTADPQDRPYYLLSVAWLFANVFATWAALHFASMPSAPRLVPTPVAPAAPEKLPQIGLSSPHRITMPSAEVLMARLTANDGDAVYVSDLYPRIIALCPEGEVLTPEQVAFACAKAYEKYAQNTERLRVAMGLMTFGTVPEALIGEDNPAAGAEARRLTVQYSGGQVLL